MKNIKIYLVGGRVIEITEADFNEFWINNFFEEQKNRIEQIIDTSGDLHYVWLKNIIEIVKPATK